MPKSRPTRRKATGRAAAPASKLTLPTLTLACAHDAYELCAHCVPNVAQKHYLREAFEALSDREKNRIAGQRRIILPDQTLTTDGKPLPQHKTEVEVFPNGDVEYFNPGGLPASIGRNALDYERADGPPIIAGSRKRAAKETNSTASTVRLLYAAARKLTPHAPPNDADIPYAVLVRECPHLPALLESLGYDPRQGYIPADLRGIAEYLVMPKGEPSEAECALRLLELGFDIVRKGTTKKATRAEIERAISRERPTLKKGN